MRTFNSTAQAIRERRTALVQVDLVWLEVSDRETGDPIGAGFWNGPGDDTITVTDLFTGVSLARGFYAGGLTEIVKPTYKTGLDIGTMDLTFSAIDSEVQTVFRGYEPRGAKIQAWQMTYDPDDYSKTTPEPVFKGWVNKAPIEIGAPGGEALINVTAVNSARILTFASGRKKSHEAQKKRTNDQFRKSKGIAGNVIVRWGPVAE